MPIPILPLLLITNFDAELSVRSLPALKTKFVVGLPLSLTCPIYQSGVFDVLNSIAVTRALLDLSIWMLAPPPPAPFVFVNFAFTLAAAADALLTSNEVLGLFVPIPTRPLVVSVTNVLLFAPAIPARMFPFTSSKYAGDVVPIPTFPPLVAKYAEPVEPMLVVEACVNVESPVTLSVPAVEIFPFDVVVAKPLTKSVLETDSCVVDALLKMFKAPENVWEARLRSATLDDKAESLIDADGSVRDPDDKVKPFEAVRSPPNVPVDCVEKAPLEVVVALPLMDSEEETDTAVVDALASVVTPVSVGDADMTILPVPVWFVVVSAVPPLIVSDGVEILDVAVNVEAVTSPPVKMPEPWTANVLNGDEVAIPTFPFASIISRLIPFVRRETELVL